MMIYIYIRGFCQRNKTYRQDSWSVLLTSARSNAAASTSESRQCRQPGYADAQSCHPIRLQTEGNAHDRIRTSCDTWSRDDGMHSQQSLQRFNFAHLFARRLAYRGLCLYCPILWHIPAQAFMHLVLKLKMIPRANIRMCLQRNSWQPLPPDRRQQRDLNLEEGKNIFPRVFRVSTQLHRISQF